MVILAEEEEDYDGHAVSSTGEACRAAGWEEMAQRERFLLKSGRVVKGDKGLEGLILVLNPLAAP